MWRDGEETLLGIHLNFGLLLRIRGKVVKGPLHMRESHGEYRNIDKWL